MNQQRRSRSALAAWATLLLAATSVGAFAPAPLTPRATSATTSLSAASSASPDVLVISPPGGMGELSAVESARLGGSVKWFVVSAPITPGSAAASPFSLTAETLDVISKAGGSMELAGAAADDLLAPAENGGNNNGGDKNSKDKNGALAAMASWCSTAPKALICTYDGAFDEQRRSDRGKTQEQLEASSGVDSEASIRGAVRAAAYSVSKSAGRKIALLAAGEEATGEEGEEEGGGGFLGALFGGGGSDVPKGLVKAMGGREGTAVVRYGEPFGAPESSPESSPFMGGPRRDPVVRDMYTMRSVRIDPSVSTSGNVLSTGGDGSKSNRLAVGEAASRLGLGKISAALDGMDVSLSSFAGTESPTDEEWDAEFGRVAAASSANGGSAPRLFVAEFASVPSTKRLAEWIATRWAPAILRSYDIAGTRVGARPVSALQTADETVEIVWVELVNFESVTSGRMIIEVTETGMTASRGPGDAAKGFGSVGSLPLPGEDILVRRLADAASQAVENGLAVKPQLAKKSEQAAKKPVTTMVAASDPAPPAQSAAATSAGGPGPRSAGARRSSERSRGGRRRAKPKSDDGES